LLKRGLITYEEALRQSTNPDDFALRVKGVMSGSDTTWEHFEGSPGTTEEEQEDEQAPQGIQKY
jgi:twitching motility protein PilT